MWPAKGSSGRRVHRTLTFEGLPPVNLYTEAETGLEIVPRAPLVSRHAMTRAETPDEAEQTEELQRWLNTFPGIFVKVDGIPGMRTSAAYRCVTGHYLPGDPRSA